MCYKTQGMPYRGSTRGQHRYVVISHLRRMPLHGVAHIFITYFFHFAARHYLISKELHSKMFARNAKTKSRSRKQKKTCYPLLARLSNVKHIQRKHTRNGKHTSNGKHLNHKIVLQSHWVEWSLVVDRAAVPLKGPATTVLNLVSGSSPKTGP